MVPIRSIIVYTIPATGHVFAMLAMVEALVRKGYRVLVYSSEAYGGYFKASGAEVCAYPMDESQIDLKDGSRLLRFQRLVLQYTALMMEPLLEDAGKYKPSLIIHDAAAHWGKRVSETCAVPAASFCSFITVGRRFNAAAVQYFFHFFRSTLRDYKELPESAKLKKQLEREYGYKGWGLVDILLSHEKLNVISYSRQMQPGGKGFSKDYFFLGPSATLRSSQLDEIRFPDDRTKIYLSLGTIYSDNRELLGQLVEALKQTGFQVYISGIERFIDIPEENREQFLVRKFFNQQQMLQHVDLFITAGGINSVCESIKAGVPCLMFPQQGEQKICCQRTHQLGFGNVADSSRPFIPQIEETLALKKFWDYGKAQAVSQVYMDQLVEKLEDLMDGNS